MRKLWALVAAAILAGCGGGSYPTAPPPPPAPSFPAMTGGWSGTSVVTQTINVSIGGQLLAPVTFNCNETWIIASQSGAVFSGTYQITAAAGSTCGASNGAIDGSVSLAGNFFATPHAVGATCTFLSGWTGDYHGFVSTAGNITATREYWMSCPDPPGLRTDSGRVDYHHVWTLTLSKR